ncbi:MAG: lipopolysaccharide heptosyltransferase II [Candidatus Ancaeobacter aquaticus]|nr:lipopolysaccharide heptosyltransferase II [Candidatus Ancaeobacter aquaticus]
MRSKKNGNKEIKDICNILVVTKNWLGDAVCTTPAIRAIKETYKEASVSVLSHPRCVQIFEGNSDLSSVIPFEIRRGVRSLFDQVRLLKILKSHAFDTVFVLHRSRSMAFLTFLSGIKYRVGYGTKGRGVFLTHPVSTPKDEDMHMIAYHLNLLEECGIKARSWDCIFPVSKEDENAAEKLIKELGLSNEDRIILIGPGGNWDRKRWPASYFAKLIDIVSDRYNVRIVLTGSQKDAYLADIIMTRTKNPPYNAMGKTTLKSFGALLKRSRLYIGNDSGPTHIAAALAVPLIAIFGPTEPKLTGPLGKGNIAVLVNSVGCTLPCHESFCDDLRCIESVLVDDVVAEVKKVLETPFNG